MNFEYSTICNSKIEHLQNQNQSYMVGSRQTGILFFSRFGLNKNMSGTVLYREYCFVEVNARTICIREESNGGGILNLFSASQITFQGIHKLDIFVGGRRFLLQRKHGLQSLQAGSIFNRFQKLFSTLIQFQCISFHIISLFHLDLQYVAHRNQ